ncbi:Fe(3+)-hydroxamate ABC transporter permease FhuB [Roseibium suaedae]|uniref:Iron complex transport system permease protein n=1 Tax=Roseibium suaedae TaxID=735517 RepID=A0A1M7PD09_9HYPH|nr:Fe(3+)-hydroxamate ABC transporter permease FhuB [Roseibium suaedae]SHN14796.1 iron complex transport system permease protein [Roseibium suaedae]
MTKRLAFLLTLLTLPAVAFTLIGYSAHVPLSRMGAALLDPDTAVFGEIYLHHSLLPRFFVAILAGAALALSGAVFQQILKNPLAEPSTLGLLSGAQLAIMIAVLVAPALSMGLRELAAIAGGFGTLGLVFLLASRQGFSPVTMLLAGMIVSFFAGTASVVLALFNHEYLRSVFIWASGSLIQNDFSNAQALTLRLLFYVPLLLLLVRPLTIAGLDEASGRSLGIPVRTLRLAALSLATLLAATVVARVGVIAFVGLAAPHLARLAGARTFPQRLIWSPVLGASLLLLADGSVMVLSRYIAEVPTGAATAFFGAFMLLLLLKKVPASVPSASDRSTSSRSKVPAHFMLGVAVLLLLCVALFSLTEHLFIGTLPLSELMSGRWPRILASLCAGAMLALAGSIMQSVTGNPLASPEGLGVSSGAALGIVGTMMLAGTFSPGALLMGGIGGALASFAVMMVITRNTAHAPGPVLLAGAAIGTFAATLIALVLASGDPRAVYVLVWSMGPTYRATAITGIAATGVLMLALVVVPFFARWLQILPLGDQAARGLGIVPWKARVTLLSLAATLTAAATLIVGPLSFVGLIAPHIAAMTTPPKTLSRAFCATAIGAALMVSADWLGRSIHFPYEIPAGVLAALIGGPYFLWLLSRKGR